MAADGKTYCARHGKDHGYVAPEKPAKRSWLVFYVSGNGFMTYRYMYDLVSERGVRMSWARNFSEKIEGIVPYTSDADFRASEDFKKWGAWFS